MFSPTCRIPLGMFFGHRFFCSWQQYAFPVLLSQFPSCPALSSSQDSQVLFEFGLGFVFFIYHFISILVYQFGSSSTVL